MNDRRPSPHLRRAKLTRRTRLVLAIAAAAFVLYRIAAVFMHAPPGYPHH